MSDQGRPPRASARLPAGEDKALAGSAAPSSGALAAAARQLGMSEQDIFDLALARSAWRSMVVGLGQGGAVRRSETFTIPIASCLQGTILAPTPARPPRPAAWLTDIRHFG
jgi:hypothetical protein